jgi:hypothetical protein
LKNGEAVEAAAYVEGSARTVKGVAVCGSQARNQIWLWAPNWDISSTYEVSASSYGVVHETWSLKSWSLHITSEGSTTWDSRGFKISRQVCE